MVKEFFGTGESAVRPDKPMTEREVVVAVVKHPFEEAYLCVQNKKFNWVDFVMGGIEGQETPVEAGKREVMEETGYTDLGELSEMQETFYDNFYAAHKDVNRHITVHTVYGQLLSLDQVERSEAEAEIADVLWVSAAELAEKLTQQAHQYIWEILQEHDTIKG